MRRVPWWSEQAVEEDQREADRQTASLGGLAIALFLVVIGLFLVRELHAMSVVEDCLMAGRTNCGATVPMRLF